MALRRPRFRLPSAGVLIALSSMAFYGVLSLLGIPFLEMIEMKAWDLHFRQRGVIEPSGMVGYVAVDEESVNREGRWPWPRRTFARLLQAVEAQGAAAIGLDLGFFEPDLKLRQEALREAAARFREDGALDPELLPAARRLAEDAELEDEDALLARALSHMKIPVTLGYFFYFQDTRSLPPQPPPEALDTATYPVVSASGAPAPGSLITAAGAEVNLPELARAAKTAGYFNVFADADGTVRWAPLAVSWGGRVFPPLALRTLAAALSPAPLMARLDAGGIREIRLGPEIIPATGKGEFLVNFLGPAGTFPHWSATKVLRGELPEGTLKDRIVFIGNTTLGLFDFRPTPTSATFPGVELHCTIAENILQGLFLSRPDAAVLYDLGTIAALCLLFLLLERFLRGWLLGAAVLVLLSGYIGATHWAFLRAGLWLNHIYPVLALASAYLGANIYRYVSEEREKRRVRTTFGLYVDGPVVEEMLTHPELLRVGGEKRELTVLFSDIRGFTSLSERLPPDVLVPQLNEYLTRMTDVVFRHRGTLDKYIGDAVMAVFGAPVPYPDHARRALAAALDMLREIEALRPRWAASGRPAFETGIGVNTGLMMVGNMGSERRFDYTVLGDNVNLASRLEGLTKVYGVPLIVSGAAWEAAGGDFTGRELDVVCVKGKAACVTVWELMGGPGERERLSEPLSLFAEGIALYRKARFAEAERSFREVLSRLPGDPPSLLYVRRCEEFLAAPPGPDWDAVTHIDEK